MNIETVAYDPNNIGTSTINGLVKLCHQPTLPYGQGYLGYQWYYTHSVVGEQVKSRLADHGITLGKNYGSEGIAVNNLVMLDSDESYYEIPALYLNILPAIIVKRLLKKHKLIIHDHPEAGKFIHQFINTYSQLLPDAREIVWAGFFDSTSNYPQYTDCHGQTYDKNSCIHLDSYIHGCGTFYTANPVVPSDKQNGSLIIPARKPTYPRIKTMAMFDSAGLLNKSNWSLFMYADSTADADDWNYKTKNWNYTPNVTVNPEKYMYDEQCVEFLQKYRQVLPKHLEGFNPTTFADHAHLDNSWAEYSWWIAIETYVNSVFPSEKTMKGFALGLPTFSIAGKGTDTYLESLGFVMEKNLDYCNTWQERVAEIIEHIKTTPQGNKEIAEHNRNHLMDKNFIVDMIAGPFIAFKEKAPTRQ